MLESEPKIGNYELGFHLWPELEDEETKKKFQEIEGIITQLGGSVYSSREPKKQHLSYPISHKHYSFFGIINFKSPTEVIPSLESQLKLNDGVFRFLVLKVRENQKVLKSLRESSGKTRAKTYTPPKPEDKPKEEIKPEVMEKQIEEVIGNI